MTILIAVVISIVAVLYLASPKASSPFHPLSIAQIQATQDYRYSPPTRDQQIERLQRETFDVLIIGGGSTGAGAALDGVSRGLKMAFVEGGDFASLTSSKSTKLIHGGVRYLEQCVLKFDPSYCYLVFEALSERKTFMDMAPYLTDELRIVTPIYHHYWQVPYLYAGLKTYDAIAAIAGIMDREKKTLTPSRYLSKTESLKHLPQLKEEGLLGSVEYSDGEFNDARMATVSLISAIEKGAVGSNYVYIESLLKENGRLVGAMAKDVLTQKTFAIRAKAVINATGPLVDKLREIDDPHASPMVAHSSGVHIAVNMKLPVKEGLLIMNAPPYEGEKLGTVTFIKPFEDSVIVGTTDVKQNFSANAEPTEREKAFLIHAFNSILAPDYQLQLSDITSAWIGFRPLVFDPKKKNTKELSRNHEIIVSDSGLISIAGGKWTTFRKMGEEVIATAIEVGKLTGEHVSHSKQMQLMGSMGYSPELAKQLITQYAIAPDIAEHLAHSYGALAVKVLDMGLTYHLMERLSPHHPYIEAEVYYAKHDEYAQSVQDVLDRRLRLSFVDEAASLAVQNKVAAIMKL